MKSIVPILGLLYSLNAVCAGQVGFKIVDPKLDKTGLVEIKNVPNVRSQDGMGLCTSFAAAAMLDFYHCKEQKLDCANVSDEDRFSTLALAKYAENTSKWANGKETEEDIPDADNQWSYKKITEGSNTRRILNAAIFFENIPKESCMPFDGLVNITSRSVQDQKNAILSLKVNYDKYKSKKETDIRSVGLEIKKACPNIDMLKIMTALGEPEYENFLYKLLIRPECFGDESNQLTVKPKELKSYPDSNDKSATVESFIEKGKQLLVSGKPFVLGSICLASEMPMTYAQRVATESKDDCIKKDPATGKNLGTSRHAVMITAYSRICDKDKKNCYDAFKVHNSWGQKWQDENSDGWVRANDLIRSTGLAPESIAWLE